MCGQTFAAFPGVRLELVVHLHVSAVLVFYLCLLKVLVELAQAMVLVGRIRRFPGLLVFGLGLVLGRLVRWLCSRRL